MIRIKSPKQIEAMQKGGHMLSVALQETLAAVRPGITEAELDAIAEKSVRRQGGEPGFMRVPGYKHTICTATNEVIVHGIPGPYKLQKGDVICVDAGVFFAGLHTDMADTVIVGGEKAATDEVRQFLAIGKQAMWAGIAQAKAGNRVGHISQAIEEIVRGAGYSVVQTLVGHGVGKELHEEPEVPGYLATKIARTPLLSEGMTLAIEVIYAMGGPEVVYANDDGWTIKTADNSLSAVFERSILVTKGDPVILTQ
ncbi:MAG TPA: type I methionyl aminopeptidase [Patescibacteria group bacterium]|nr:type I methionyl aminopeptidase [Patescibacteria group bacterium]